MGSIREAYIPHPRTPIEGGCAVVDIEQIPGLALQVDLRKYTTGRPYSDKALELSTGLVRAWWDSGIRIGHEAMATDMAQRQGDMYLQATLHSGREERKAAYARLEKQQWPAPLESPGIIVNELEAVGLQFGDDDPSVADPVVAMDRYCTAALVRYICDKATSGVDPVDRKTELHVLFPTRLFELEEVGPDGAAVVHRGKETRHPDFFASIGAATLMYDVPWGDRGSMFYGTIQNISKYLSNNYNLPQYT